jgi:hypothetical protein
MRTFVSAFGFFFWATQACSSPSSERAGSGGANEGDAAGSGGSSAIDSGVTGGVGVTGGFGGTSGSGGTGPVCNELPEDAPTYSITWTTGVAPAPMGGAIADGSYVLTRQTGYVKNALPAIEIGRWRVKIAGGTWQEVEGILPYDENPDRHSNSTVSAQGTMLTLTPVCPSAGEPNVWPYTADATGLTLFIVDSGVTFETVLTRETSE